MIVYRLCKARHQNDLSGKGARMYGGRWNNPGTAMLYTSESRALCLLEAVVHLPIGLLPDDYVMLSIDVPDDSPFYQPDLPPNWKKLPHSAATRQIGDDFVRKGEYLLMRVSSAVVDGEFNYLINPNHRDFDLKTVYREHFDMDMRLFIR